MGAHSTQSWWSVRLDQNYNYNIIHHATKERTEQAGSKASGKLSTIPLEPELTSQKGEKKDNVDEAPLQAVILADSYNRRFEVLCSDTPRILLPLCSTPLLTWTLEALSLSRVKQVFVFCGVHADQVREFVS
jgi:hypothetical protein